MNKFEPGQYVCHNTDKDQCVKYLIQMVREDEQVYKAFRQDTKGIVEIPFKKEDDYMVAEAPEDPSTYQVGQILLKKTGTPRIAVICHIKPSQEDHLTDYEVSVFTPKGQYVQTAIYKKREIIEDFEIRNLKWVVEYGNPKKVVSQELDTEIAELEKEIAQKRRIRDSLIYFETEVEKNISAN